MDNYTITNKLNHVRIKSPNGNIKLYEKGSYNATLKGDVIEFRENLGGGIFRIPIAGQTYVIEDDVAGYNPATPSNIRDLFDLIAPYFLGF